MKSPQLELEKFVYAAYTWRSIESEDSTHFSFYLDRYFETDKSGRCLIFHHDTTKYWGTDPVYFSANLNTHQINTLNFLFLDSNYVEDYFPPPGTTLYHGFDYYIEYISPKTGKHTILFWPRYAPESIWNLKLMLDAIIFKVGNDTINPFDLKDAMESIIKYSPEPNPIGPPPKRAVPIRPDK